MMCARCLLMCRADRANQARKIFQTLPESSGQSTARAAAAVDDHDHDDFTHYAPSETGPTICFCCAAMVAAQVRAPPHRGPRTKKTKNSPKRAQSIPKRAHHPKGWPVVAGGGGDIQEERTHNSKKHNLKSLLILAHLSYFLQRAIRFPAAPGSSPTHRAIQRKRESLGNVLIIPHYVCLRSLRSHWAALGFQKNSFIPSWFVSSEMNKHCQTIVQLT